MTVHAASLRGRQWGALLGAVCCFALLGAAPPAEQIVPKNSVGLLVFPDFIKIRERWPHTGLGKFLDDPAMTDFTQHLSERARDRFGKGGVAQNITFAELEALASGQVAIAISRTTLGNSVTTLICDIAGNGDDTKAVLAKVAKGLAADGAKQRSQVVAGVTLTIFDLPPAKDATPAAVPARPATKAPAGKAAPRPAVGRRPAPKPYQPTNLIHWIKDDVLVVCDDLKTATDLVTRWASKPEEALGSTAGYKGVEQRLAEDSGKLVPHVRFFIYPLGFMEAERTDHPERRNPSEPDMLKIAKGEGLGAILGLGGHINLQHENKYDSYFRLAVYAPVIPPKGGIRALTFPNGGDHLPPKWVPDSIAGFVSANWNINLAFDSIGSVFDQILEEEGSFEELIRDVKEDPNGPKIDLRADLVKLLGTKVAVVADSRQPFSTTSRQQMLVVEVLDPALFAKNVAASVEKDKNVTKREYLGHTIYEFHDVPQAGKAIKRPNGQPAVIVPAPGGANMNIVSPPPPAVCVAHNVLLAATNAQLIEKVLQAHNESDALGRKGGQFEFVMKELDALGLSPASAKVFIRTAESVEPSYELVRQGQLDQEQSALGAVLREVLGSDKQAKVKLQGNKLPAFNVVRHHFGLLGLTARTETGYGWFGKGFLIPSDRVPQENAAAKLEP